MSSSQAELLKRKREARKQKILSNSKDRLDQITQSYTANNPDLDDDKDFASEIASLPASSAAKDDGDESIHEVLDKAPSATAKPSATDDVDDGDQKEVMPKISSTPNRLQQNSTPLFVQEAELPPYDPLSTYDPNDTTSPAPSLQFSDTLSWLHAILLSLLISYSLINWILNHTHDMFSLGSLVQDLAHKRICRQLYFMAYNPVHEDLGASSIISFLGYSSPAWQFFLSLELGLLSARFYTIQRSKETAPFAIPDAAKPFMLQYGFDPVFYEKLISGAYGYYDMYDTLMRDMYLLLGLFGIAISVSVILHSLGLCH